MRQYSTIFLWQGDGKNGAFSWNTVSTKPSAVQFDYFPANRQPLSITLKLWRRVQTLERFENFLQVLGIKSNSVILQ